jgi:hypothetical protein
LPKEDTGREVMGDDRRTNNEVADTAFRFDVSLVASAWLVVTSRKFVTSVGRAATVAIDALNIVRPRVENFMMNIASW